MFLLFIFYLYFFPVIFLLLFIVVEVVYELDLKTVKYGAFKKTITEEIVL